MTEKERRRWDDRYRGQDPAAGLRPPAAILRDARRWLPAGGRVLDLACGPGRNALWLADRGYSVLGVDISSVALRRLADRARRRARDREGSVQAVRADLSEFSVRPAAFRIVLNVRFLLRATFPLIRRSLVPGGLLLFETFSVDEIDELGGDIRREYVLERKELRRAFADFEILLYEEGIFQRQEGERGLARLAARKPARSHS